MEYDNEALEAKRKEIVRLANDSLSPSLMAGTKIVDSVVQSFVTLTPPTKPPQVFDFITLSSSGEGRASSRKPGNIYLNWRKLFDTVPNVTIAAVGGATSPPWMLPFVALSIWNKLWSSAEETLSEIEATIIYALWKNRNHQNKISENDGFNMTNKHREEIGLKALSRTEFDTAINRLLEIKCVEIEEGIIWLQEWVRIEY